MADLEFDDLIPKTRLKEDERDLLVRTVYGEAGNEPPEGQQAVAAVIRNRMAAGSYGGRGVSDVVLAPNQFEPWNRDDARARMMSLSPDDPKYKEIAQHVDDVFNGRTPDPTGGATHFYAPEAQRQLGRNPPSWDDGTGMPIGRHSFFAPEGKVRAVTPQFDDLIEKQTPADQPQPRNRLATLDFTDLIPGQQPQPQQGDPAEGTVWGEPPQNAPARPWALTRGFVTGLMKQNPEMGAEAFEGFSTLAGETDHRPLGSVADSLREIAKQSPQDYAVDGMSMWNLPTVSDALTWAGETVGQGVASSVPSIATGVAGAVIGSRAGGKVGGIAGGALGSMTPSFMMNYGEVYKALKDAGVEKGRAAELGLYAAGPMAALDAVSVGPIISRLGGLSAAKQEVARNIAARIASEGMKGAGREGVTEAAQEAVKIGTVSLETDKPFWTTENVKQMVESGVGGALTGGAMGGVGGITPDRVVPTTPPSPAAVNATVADMMGGIKAEPIRVMANMAGPQQEPPGPVFYSQVQRMVEEKGPNAATGEQWLATLQNQPGVKKEEISALGLDSYFMGREGRITKSDVIAQIEDNRIAIQEVYKTKGETQFDGYTTPGGRNYRELLLTIPQSLDDNNNFQGSHWSEPNVLGHVRFTDREDITGQTVLHVEEIQSDWHQKGRKAGYGKGYAGEELRARVDAIDARYGYNFWSMPLDVREEVQNLWDQINEIESNGGRVPDAPFKTSWPELLIKRMIRHAADNGYSRMTFNSGELAAQFVTGQGEHVRDKTRSGNLEFYDRIVPSILKKLAKNIGAQVTTTTIQASDSNFGYQIEDEGFPDAPEYNVYDQNYRYIEGFRTQREAQEYIDKQNVGKSPIGAKVFAIDLPPTAQSRVRRGFPMFSKVAPTIGKVTVTADENIVHAINSEQGEHSRAVVGMLKKFARQFKVGMDIRVNFQSDSTSNYKGLAGHYDNYYTIDLNLALHPTVQELYATAVHEFGHILMFDKFDKLSTKEQQSIRNAYERFRRDTPVRQSFAELIARRDNAINNWYRTKEFGNASKLPLYMLNPVERQYWIGFDEWFAEQVARWATTNERALTVADKLIKSFGGLLRALHNAAAKLLGMTFEPTAAMRDWLNSSYDSPLSIGHEIIPELDRRTQEDNQRYLNTVDSEIRATSQTPETELPRRAMASLFKGQVPPGVMGALAMGDKMNSFYKWTHSLQQIAEINRHINPLQRYKEDVQLMDLEIKKVQDAALTISKNWSQLGEQGDNVGRLIDQLNHMTYLTPDERAQKVVRQPTQQELQQMVKANKVTAEGFEVFNQIRRSFDMFLTLVEQQTIAKAAQIQDLSAQATAVANIQKRFANYRKRPYFPMMRFGRHTITVRAKDTQERIAVEFVERKGFISAERMQLRRAKELQKDYPPSDFDLQLGVIAEAAEEFIGMPRPLLELMSERLDLSEKQRDALQQLTFELAPEQSFQHRWQHRKLVPGYSNDFKRAYAKYFFHGANWFGKIKYAPRLLSDLKQLRLGAASVKRGDIGNFVADHYRELMNPTADFLGGKLRGAMFFWGIAGSLAAASLNASQVLTTTWPNIAGRFGEKGALAIAKNSLDLRNFYKRGNFAGLTEPKMRAFDAAVKGGIITEMMAPELLAIGQGQNLLQGFGSNRLEKYWNIALQATAMPFETVEQFNRRVTFGATWDLAMKNPNNPYVGESIRRHAQLFAQLQQQGFTPQEAGAYVTAKASVETTQFIYAPHAQPRFMRGKMRTVFVFKSYLQNMLFLLGSGSTPNPVRVRMFLMIMLMGGLMGVPGSEDLAGIAKAMAWWVFGKNFDLEREAREMILGLFNGKVSPDIILHGSSRVGFGIPHLLDYMGNTAGYGNVPYPVLDRSRAVSMGTILPMDVGKVLGPPQKDNSRMLLDQAQKAAGAGYGLIFNAFKLMSSGDEMADAKKWESVAPRMIASPSKAWRAFSEGRERDKTGKTVLRYDRDNPEHMAEIIAMALGYNTYRRQLAWDRRIAYYEVEQFWSQQRVHLLEQLFVAQRYGKTDEEKAQKAIKEYNANTPYKEYTITAETIKRSFATREKAHDAAEQGSLARTKAQHQVEDHIKRLYPEAEVVRQKVPK